MRKRNGRLSSKPFNLRRIYLPLFVVPLILCLLLSVAVYSVTRRQLNETGRITVEQFRSQSENILNELKIVSSALLGNSQFIQAVTKDNINSSDIVSVSDMLLHQLRGCKDISEIYVFAPDQNKIYSSRTDFNYSSWQSILIAENIIYEQNTSAAPDDYLKEGWSVPETMYGPPYYVTEISTQIGDRQATMVAVLNKSALYRSMISSNYIFCCMYDGDFAIASLLQNPSDVDYTSEADIAAAVGEPVKLFSVNTDSFSYMVAIAKRSFYRPLYVMLIAFAVYYLILLVFGLFYILRIRKTEKALYEGIVAELPQPLNENPSIQSVFSSIKESLEKYKSEQTALSRQVKVQNLSRFVHGRMSLFLDNEMYDSMGINTASGCYYVGRFQINDNGIVNDEHRSDLTCILLESALNAFSKDSCAVICFSLDRNDLCAIIQCVGDGPGGSGIVRIVRNSSILMEKDYGTTMRCFLSNPVKDPAEIPDAFTEAKNLQRFLHLINSDTQIITASQFRSSSASLLKGDFLKQMQTLTNTLILGKYDMIPSMVDSIISEHISSSSDDFALAQSRMGALISTLQEVPVPESLDNEHFQNLKKQLKNADSVFSLSQAVHELFEKMIPPAEEDTPVKKACSYIHEHISDISLGVPEIAEATNISVPHLSRLFRAELHMTMVEYINQYRIEKAKSLLSDTKMTIALIAEAAGYSNTVTFTRNFRKYVSCSPAEFRNHKKND